VSKVIQVRVSDGEYARLASQLKDGQTMSALARQLLGVTVPSRNCNASVTQRDRQSGNQVTDKVTTKVTQERQPGCSYQKLCSRSENCCHKWWGNRCFLANWKEAECHLPKEEWEALPERMI